MEVVVVDESALTPKQSRTMLQLQAHCFFDLSAEEIEEDFNRPSIARVLAYSENVLIDCAEIFKLEIEKHKWLQRQI